MNDSRPFTRRGGGDHRQGLRRCDTGLKRDQLLSTGKRIDGGHGEIRPSPVLLAPFPERMAPRYSPGVRHRRWRSPPSGHPMTSRRSNPSTRERRTRPSCSLQFHPFSVGEVSMLRGPTRREIGHGNLAERALTRSCREGGISVHRSGSSRRSSNRTALFDGHGMRRLPFAHGRRVPIKEPVAGIAMGLVK